jgi:hypothetical protein
MSEIDLEKLQKDFNADKEHNSDTRQNAQNLLYFYMISHYNNELRDQLPLKFQGQFDNLKKSGRKIISDLITQEVQADFTPLGDTGPELSDLMDKLYRTDARRNISIEASENATMEQVPCGIGGWRWVNKWETGRIGDRNQIMERVPIHEFNSRVFFDCSAVLQDKSDAKRCHIVTGYSKEGLEELIEQYKGEEDDEHDSEGDGGGLGVTPERGKNQVIYESADAYAVESYYRHREKITVIFFEDEAGEIFAYDKKDVKGMEAQLKADGKKRFDSKVIEVWKVTKYTWTNKEILDQTVIAGPNIPVIPCYGERLFVNGVEHYEGITRAAKDAAMLRDFLYSYAADIATSTPRSIPSYFPEQIAGHEWQYSQTGADSSLPYRLTNMYAQGSDVPLPVGPVFESPPPQLPPALVQTIQVVNESLSESSQSGAPNSISDVDLSGTAVSELRAMLDENSIIFRRGYKNAMRRDAEVWMGMAPEVYGIERKVLGTNKDGTREEIEINKPDYDFVSGKDIVLNNLVKGAFEVGIELSEGFGSQRQQQRKELGAMLTSVPPGTPEFRMLMFKYFELSDSSSLSDIKKYATKQLLIDGIKEPDSEEEMEIVRQAQESEGPVDANMELAKAEQMKAQVQAEKSQLDHQVAVFNAETQRIKVISDAEQANSTLALREAELVAKRIDSMQKTAGGMQ